MPPTLTPSRASDALLDLVPDPIWVVDASGTITSYNPAFERWWEALTGSRPQRGMTVDPASSIHEAQQRALHGRAVMLDVHFVVSGVDRAFVIHASPLRRDSAVVAAGFIVRAVAERSQSYDAVELALTNLFASESEPLAGLLAKTIEFLCSIEGWDGGAVWTLDAGENKLRAVASWFTDPEVAAQIGPRLEPLRFEFGQGVPGRVWSTGEIVWIPDILDESMLQRAEMLAAAGLHSVVGAPLTDTTRVVGVIEFFTRAVRPISERRKRMLLRSGTALGRLLERRRAEDERRWLLAQIERKGAEWMQTFDAIELPIFLVNANGTIARLNRAARDFAGAGYGDLLGRDLHAIGTGEPWATLADTAQAVCDSGVGCTAQIASGEKTWDVSANLISGQERDERRVVIVLRDLTQILSLQDAVRRGEQLAALGELVAGVAHEVKNPIFGMGVTIDLLLERVDAASEDAELLGALRKWLVRLNNLSENLLEYGKTWNINLAPGNASDAVQQAIDSCQPRASEAGVTVTCAADDALILMDDRRLNHVFENLITNAIQFSPEGGTVTITARRMDSEVEYTVRDRGPGFEQDDLPRVFQPFFTRRRGGTGLGLSIVQRVIDEHGGTIDAGNHEEGGAVVRVRFPLYVPPV